MRVSEGCVLALKNKSHSVTAQLIIPESGALGVIVNQGGSIGAGASMRIKVGCSTATTSSASTTS
jgi:hypothetical protein